MTTKATLFNRPNLGESLMDAVREMVFEGRLPPGSRINEVHLAQELGVSRTPLREALSGLVAEGALESVARHGFYVRNLTRDEAVAIYPIRSFLDTEALRLSGTPGPASFKRLESLSLRLSECTDVYDAIRLDDAWHEELWRRCPNPVLIDLIRQFMRRTRRYELASMRHPADLHQSARAKMEIEKLLRAGDLNGACARLRKSLQNGVKPVLRWLEERESSQDS